MISQEQKKPAKPRKQISTVKTCFRRCRHSAQISAHISGQCGKDFIIVFLCFSAYSPAHLLERWGRDPATHRKFVERLLTTMVFKQRTACSPSNGAPRHELHKNPTSVTT